MLPPCAEACGGWVMNVWLQRLERCSSHIAMKEWKFTVILSMQMDTDQNGEGDPSAAEQMGRIFEQEQPDIVHLHALTSGVSLRVLREARRRGIKTVLTYHTPTVSCVRGTLMYRATRSVTGG